MNKLSYDKTFKILCYLIIPFALYSLIVSFDDNSVSTIHNEKVLGISFDNQIIDGKFNNLFEDSEPSPSIEKKEILLEDLGVELAGIVAMKNQPDRGYIILNFLDKKVDKNIFSPGDKIDSNIFLESIHSNYIEVSIANKIYQIYLSDKKRVTEVDGVIKLDVSLLEILPYLKIDKGSINGTQGIYISDRLDGKIIEKLHLKETDLLFNLSGYNVFNLATLNDAYRKLENRKEIVASIYRDGKIKKLIARRIDV